MGTVSLCITDMQDPERQATFMVRQRKTPEVLFGSQNLANAVRAVLVRWLGQRE